MMKYNINELKQIKENIPFIKLCHRNIRFNDIPYLQENTDGIVFVIRYESLSGLYKNACICIQLLVNGTFNCTISQMGSETKLHIKCYELVKKRIATYLTLMGFKEL